jgi:hypothetical protein
MIRTVGELREALKDYNDANPIHLQAGGGAAAFQQFPIESVGHDPRSVILNIGLECQADGNERR